MTTAPKNPPVMLLIFDGWGLRQNGPGNAIEEANPTCYNQLLANHPWIAIDASGNSVGLPEGQIGNSEVGHMTLGAGRIIYMDLTKIDRAIEDNSFFANPQFLNAMAHVKTHDSTLHLMGLVGPGGVHSHQNHLLALLDLAKQQGIQKLAVHAFLDGRDVPPKSAMDALEAVEQKLLDLDYPQIQTTTGRYWAMDRDNRWDRVQKAYDCLVSGSGTRHFLSIKALEYGYKTDVTDEFIDPSVTDITYQGMTDNDAVIFFNFRPDRARQLTRAMTQPDFDGFERSKVLHNLYFVCMTPYEASLNLPVAFPKEPLTHILPQVVSEAGLKQFRCAETEKYAHVTYFFNGGQEQPFWGEDRQLIDSPKVSTYDHQPQMSLPAVADAVVAAVESGQYALLVVNFANPDMVGHTGVAPAAVEAIQAVDAALNRINKAMAAAGGTMLITADHGNIETMQQEDGSPHTAHTTNPVPLILVSPDQTLDLKRNGEYGLSNVAPTLLGLLNLSQPPEMTAESLLVRRPAPVAS